MDTPTTPDIAEPLAARNKPCDACVRRFAVKGTRFEKVHEEFAAMTRQFAPADQLCPTGSCHVDAADVPERRGIETTCREVLAAITDAITGAVTDLQTEMVRRLDRIEDKLDRALSPRVRPTRRRK